MPIQPFAETAGKRSLREREAQHGAAAGDRDRRGVADIAARPEIDRRARRLRFVVVQGKSRGVDRDAGAPSAGIAAERQRGARGATQPLIAEQRRQPCEIGRGQHGIAAERAAGGSDVAAGLQRAGPRSDGESADGEDAVHEARGGIEMRAIADESRESRRQQRGDARIPFRAEAIAIAAGEAERRVEAGIGAGVRREAASPVGERSLAGKVQCERQRLRPAQPLRGQATARLGDVGGELEPYRRTAQRRMKPYVAGRAVDAAEIEIGGGFAAAQREAARERRYDRLAEELTPECQRVDRRVLDPDREREVAQPKEVAAAAAAPGDREAADVEARHPHATGQQVARRQGGMDALDNDARSRGVDGLDLGDGDVERHEAADAGDDDPLVVVGERPADRRGEPVLAERRLQEPKHQRRPQQQAGEQGRCPTDDPAPSGHSIRTLGRC